MDKLSSNSVQSLYLQSLPLAALPEEQHDIVLQKLTSALALRCSNGFCLSEETANMYSDIGNILFIKQDYLMAGMHYITALKIYHAVFQEKIFYNPAIFENGFGFKLVNIYMLLGHCLMEQKDYDNAFKNYLSVIYLCHQSPSSMSPTLIQCLTQLSTICLLQNKPDQAERYTCQALRYKAHEGSDPHISFSLSHLSEEFKKITL